MARVVFKGKGTMEARVRERKAQRQRELGRAIRIARINKGLRQQDVAAYLGTKKPAVCQIELGRHRVTDKRLARIEELLGKVATKRPRRRQSGTLQEFGLAVTAARMHAGMSKKELADKLDICDTRLSRMEAGKKKPRPQEIKRLEALLGTKLPRPDAYCHAYPTKRPKRPAESKELATAA